MEEQLIFIDINDDIINVNDISNISRIHRVTAGEYGFSIERFSQNPPIIVRSKYDHDINPNEYKTIYNTRESILVEINKIGKIIKV